MQFEPHDDVSASQGRDEQVRRALIQYASEHRRRSRRWLTIAPVAALLVAGLTGGAIALLLPVWNQNTVHCLARAEIAPDGSYPGTQLAYSPTGDGAEQIEDAIAACAQPWRDGLLDESSVDGLRRDASGAPEIASEPQPVPERLTVCVMRDGSAAVVPGEDEACATLGLARKLP